mmetsp:Transcript_57854/g.176221  ORF Transcript_57854/g.176221 Transcript_57854/m.176221 type:complete len:406 (-) Transcript_57854:86-1303(-)
MPPGAQKDAVQSGVTYPREVPRPDGLPEGWTAIEYAYKTGKCVGKTYIRFNSPTKKDNIGSVKLAIRQHAINLGKSWDEATEEAEEWQRQQAAKKQEEREACGYVSPEMRDEAITAFRVKYGALDGATTAKLTGWQALSLFRETCGQTQVIYVNPQGKRFGTVKDVEASLGVRVLRGEEITEVAEARSKIKVDDKGRAIHDARVNVALTRTAEDVAREKEEMKRQREQQVMLGKLASSKKNRTVGPESYVERPWPHVLAVPPAAGGEAWAALEEPLRQEAMAIAEILVERHGFVAPELLALQGCPRDDPHVTNLSGLFHLRPGGFNDRPLYQQVFRHPGGPLSCTGVYIFWSQHRERWKIGPLDDRMAPFAYLPVDRASPVGGANGAAPQWWVHTEDAASPPASA